MQVLKSATEEEGNQLEPTLSAHVEFKGSTVKGLTHVHSHHCMHEISASGTGKAETKGIGSYGVGSSGQVTLGTPSLLLHNYGGDKFKWLLSVFSQQPLQEEVIRVLPQYWYTRMPLLICC